MEGEDRGLDAEAEEGEDEDRQQLLLPSGDERHVQNAAVGEVEAVREVAEVHQADEHEGRARHGVEHVFLARAPGLGVHLVHDQRQRHEGHELVAEVEGEEVCGVGDARHHAEGDDEEAEEEVFPSLMFHVGEGVDGRDRPEHADDAAEDEGDPVGPEGKLQMP